MKLQYKYILQMLKTSHLFQDLASYGLEIKDT